MPLLLKIKVLELTLRDAVSWIQSKDMPLIKKAFCESQLLIWPTNHLEQSNRLIVAYNCQLSRPFAFQSVILRLIVKE